MKRRNDLFSCASRYASISVSSSSSTAWAMSDPPALGLPSGPLVPRFAVDPRDDRPADAHVPLISEISFLLLLLHRPALVVVDDPPLPLRRGGQQRLLDDVGERRCRALD